MSRKSWLEKMCLGLCFLIPQTHTGSGTGGSFFLNPFAERKKGWVNFAYYPVMNAHIIFPGPLF